VRRPPSTSPAPRHWSQASAAAPRSPKAQVLGLGRNRCQEAVRDYEAAFTINSTGVLNGFGHCKLFTGAPEEAVAALEQAIRISPRDQQIGLFYWQIGRVRLVQSRVDEAIYWLEKARSAMPEPVYLHAFLAAAYGLKGDTEHAAAELEEARRMGGKGSLSSFARVKAGLSQTYFDVPKVRDWFEATYLAGLRKAGMPDE
jgi:adenylate cyclase